MNEESPLFADSGSITSGQQLQQQQQPARTRSWIRRRSQKTRGQRKHSSVVETQQPKGPLEAIFTMESEPTDPDHLARELIHHEQPQNSGDDGSADDHDHSHHSERISITRSENDAIHDDEDHTFENRSFSSMSSSSPEKLGVISMAVMVFYTVSGGPFGIETTVRAGGNLYAILGFLIMPFVWSLQEALMTAELGTAFPEASGGVAWVEEAFGPGAGWMAGYTNWLSGATDNAIYPVLFLDYMLQYVDNSHGDDSETIAPAIRFCLLTTTTIVLAYINWRGLALVGKMSVLICVVAMSPFVILIVVGSFKVDPSRWWRLPDADVDSTMAAMDDDIAGGFLPNFSPAGVLWRPFLNNLSWNLNSFDSAACFVAELDSTASFVRSMMLGVLLVVSGYFFPLLIAIGSLDSEQADWNDGYLAVVTTEVVGPWLGAWTVFAAGISNIGLFQAELSSDAFQLMGMADRGYLPKIFGQRSKHGTPTYGLILGTAVIVTMGVSDIDRLIEMLNFNYGIALLLEYAAFFKLRVSRPNLERPYRIPLSTLGCALFFFPTIASTVFVMSLATYATYNFSLGSCTIGYLLYVAKRRNEQGGFLDSMGNNRNGEFMRVADELSFEDEGTETVEETEVVSDEY